MEVGGKLKPIWEQEYDQHCNPLKPWPGEETTIAETSDVPRDQHGLLKSGTVFVKEGQEKTPSLFDRLEATEKVNQEILERLKPLVDLKHKLEIYAKLKELTKKVTELEARLVTVECRTSVTPSFSVPVHVPPVLPQ